MNDVATALYTTIRDNSDIQTLDATVYTGQAPRDAEYPFITLMPVSDIPQRTMNEDPFVFTRWDCKIWAKSMKTIGDIYGILIDILNDNNLSDDFYYFTAR